MALVTKVFSINITPGEMPPTIHVSEYDVGRAYNVTLIGENGSAFEIPTGTTATVEGTLNGTTGFTTSATISNNQISFALTESMTAYSGKAWCKIKLTLNDEPIQTCAFILAVDRAGVEAETVIGAPGFEEQIQEAVDNYLDEHPVGVEVDPTLSIEGAAADAKATGDKFKEFFSFSSGGGGSSQQSYNLLNLNDPDIQQNKKFSSDGSSIRAAIVDSEGTNITGYIPVVGSQPYCLHYPSSLAKHAFWVVLYDENKVAYDYFDPYDADWLTDANGHKYCRFTLSASTRARYCRYWVDASEASSYYMFVAAETMPSEYQPYGSGGSPSFDKSLKPDVSVPVDTTLSVSGKPADAKAVGDAINAISDGIFEEIEIHPYDTTDGRDMMANGSTIAGTNNIWHYRNLPNRVHIVGSSALGSNKAVVWIVNGSTMLSAPITGTNESIDQWIDLPDNATGIWVSNPATPTVAVKVNATKDIYARSYAEITEQTTEETALSYYAVDSGHHMTVNGTLSSYSSANIWKFKDLPDRVHVTGSSTGLSGSIAVMWWVANGAMVSAPIYGSHSVIDKWFDVPNGVEELWLNDGGGNNQVTTLTSIDLVARKKAAELEEAMSGAVSIGSQWAGKNWFAYGTSITGGSKMKYPPYLAQMSGLLLNNKGIGGEGIGDLGAGSTGKVYDAICNITDGKLAADLITLETGANDIGDNVPLGTIYDTGRSTLSGCLNDCIRYLQANTDAQIVVTVSPATKTIPSATWKYYEWAEMVEQICKINRVHFVNGDNGMGYAKLSTQGKGSLYVIDPIHQTDLGGYIMAQNIWYQLRNIPLFYTQMPN